MHLEESSLFLKCLFFSTAREAELRRLRKANVEFEEQNTILQKHIAEMFSAKERLEAELGQDELRTQALHRRLQAIKQTLVNSLASVPLPGQSLRCFFASVKQYTTEMGYCPGTVQVKYL